MAQMESMTCPGCVQPLFMVGDPGRRVFNCESCGGLAILLPVLRKISTGTLVTDLWRHAGLAKEPGRRCPSCRQSMALVGLGYNNTLHLDVCRTCQLVWFDLGELAVFSPLPAATEPPAELPEQAKLLLAQAKLDRIRNEVSLNKDLNRKKRGDDNDIMPGVWEVLWDIFWGSTDGGQR